MFRMKLFSRNLARSKTKSRTVLTLRSRSYNIQSSCVTSDKLTNYLDNVVNVQLCLVTDSQIILIRESSWCLLFIHINQIKMDNW